MSNESNLSRRGFLATGGAAAAIAALMPSAPASASTFSVERANEERVLGLCRDIAEVDPAKLAPYLAEDFQFQLFEGQPIVDGKEAFLNFVTTFLEPFERAEFIVHRSQAIGNLVINERTDNFFAKEGGQDQSFHVTGFCWVHNGLIKEWKDYSVPAEASA